MDGEAGVGATVRRRRLALSVATAVPILVLLGLPFAQVELGEVVAYLPMWVAFTLSCFILTAALLLVLYRQGAGVRVLILAGAYAVSGALIAMLAFSMPGVISYEPSFAQASPGWIWIYQHLVPPAIFAAALMNWPEHWAKRFDSAPPTWQRAVGVVGSLVLVGPGLLLLVLLSAPEALPALVNPDSGEYLPGVIVITVGVNLVVVALAITGVARRLGQSGIEVWALVAAVAMLGDVAFTFMTPEEFTLAFYAARGLGMAASAFVLAALLSEVVLVRRHLLRGTRDLEVQVSELLEGQRLREHISAVVSHDMRAPIAGLQGYLEILQDGETDAAFVDRVHERCLVLVKRLSLLTEDMQAAALAANGDLDVLPEILDVESQLHESAEGFPGLDLRLDCEPGLTVWADPLRLQQVLANLIRNAEKHGAEPVFIQARSETDGMVVLRVSDAGPGVPETFIPRLFERYSQGPDAAPGGSGLGLSVARDLVRAHQGTVRYDLTDPAFIVTLPAAPTEIRTPSGRVISPPRRMAMIVKR
jgi:signal transduction histidine kinase